MKMTIIEGLEALEIEQRPRLVITPDELFGFPAGECPIDLNEEELACVAQLQDKLKHYVAKGTTVSEVAEP